MAAADQTERRFWVQCPNTVADPVHAFAPWEEETRAPRLANPFSRKRIRFLLATCSTPAAHLRRFRAVPGLRFFPGCRRLPPRPEQVRGSCIHTVNIRHWHLPTRLRIQNALGSSDSRKRLSRFPLVPAFPSRMASPSAHRRHLPTRTPPPRGHRTRNCTRNTRRWPLQCRRRTQTVRGSSGSKRRS